MDAGPGAGARHRLAVSLAHLTAAWLVPMGGPVGCPGSLTKLVLLALADHACEHCGLAWPGKQKLAEKTLLGPTRIKTALDELAKIGLVTVHKYPKGGRGRATEYVVLPAVAAHQAPCPRCVNAQKHAGRAAPGFHGPR